MHLLLLLRRKTDGKLQQRERRMKLAARMELERNLDTKRRGGDPS